MTSFANTLKQADIFYQLTPTQLEMISNICEEKTFDAEEIIIKEGASSDELYLIMQGEVDIQVNPALITNQPSDKFEPVTIVTMGRGQSFGEIALVDRGVRSATARSRLDNTRLLIIPRDKLMLLCDTYPPLGYRLMQNLAADLALKLRNTDLRVRQEMLSTAYKK
jgi:CRP/FNR family cyclic AMP-dependent transcriptional regulator